MSYNSMYSKKLFGYILIFTIVFTAGAITAAYNKWLTDIFVIRIINDTSKVITKVSLFCNADVQTHIHIPVVELHPDHVLNLEVVSHGSAINCKAAVTFDNNKVIEQIGGAIPPLNSNWISLHFTE